jgi:hypothetical protein
LKAAIGVTSTASSGLTFSRLAPSDRAKKILKTDFEKFQFSILPEIFAQTDGADRGSVKPEGGVSP